MTNIDHKNLANFLKGVHSSLRKLSTEIGVDKAWQKHCLNYEVLQAYAICMEKLATTHWDENCASDLNAATSRIKWASSFCYDYFVKENYLKFQEKETAIAKKINNVVNNYEHSSCSFSVPVKLLDVGSCYNPFRAYDFLDVFAIDLYPANDYVHQCDFLNVPLGLHTLLENNKVETLAKCSFDVVTFCFLLEYIPSSELRIKACEKAYSLLKPSGLLIINTPDSKHVGANYKLMKCWRYTLANLGFTRIKYEKHKHMHCMAYRKTFNKAIAERWAIIHKESYMQLSIHIPQDCTKYDDTPIGQRVTADAEDFSHLPFYDFINEL